MEITIQNEFINKIKYYKKDNFQVFEISKESFTVIINVLADSYFWTQIIYDNNGQILVSEKFDIQDYQYIKSFEERFILLNNEINNCIDDLLNCQTRYLEENTRFGKNQIFQVYKNNAWVDYISNWNYRAFWKK